MGAGALIRFQLPYGQIRVACVFRSSLKLFVLKILVSSTKIRFGKGYVMQGNVFMICARFCAAKAFNMHLHLSCKRILDQITSS